VKIIVFNENGFNIFKYFYQLNLNYLNHLNSWLMNAEEMAKCRSPSCGTSICHPPYFTIAYTGKQVNQ
jgi:hypothetical protein